MKNQTKHILVIRLSAMGDVAMAALVVKAACQQNPNLKITVLSRAFLKPLFEEIPNISFYAIDTKKKHKGLLGIFNLYKELRHLKIDAIADLHNVLRSKILRSLFWYKKTAYINKGRADKKALTRAKNKVFKQLKTTHERYADVFRKLGYSIVLDAIVKRQEKGVTQKLTEIIGEKNEHTKLIGIAPFAQHVAKTYPLDLMEQVIENYSQRENSKLLLFGGGKKEQALLEKIEASYKNTYSIAGKVSLNEELLLIANLDCMLSMDSGNAHFAALYGVPTVTVWGATHPYAGFAPFGQAANCLIPDLKKYPKIPTSIYGNKIVEGYEDVMRSISPERINEKIDEIIGS
ncbi:MAG: glycosyltransferase family 9 protein [Flavicella sp.]